MTKVPTTKVPIKERMVETHPHQLVDGNWSMDNWSMSQLVDGNWSMDNWSMSQLVNGNWSTDNWSMSQLVYESVAGRWQLVDGQLADESIG